MTGSLQVKNDIYYAVLNYKDEGNKYRQKWFNTGLDIKGNKRKAENYLNNLKTQYKPEDFYETPKTGLLSEYILKWLEIKKNKVEMSTWEGYELYSKKHIIPYFDKLNLSINEVTPKHIKDYYEFKYRGGRLDKKAGGLSVQAIKKHGIVLKQVFNEAVINEVIQRNPAANVPLPRQEENIQKGVFLTAEEANKVLQAFRGHNLQPLIFTTLYYGLRRSEVLGLKWSAIDFENNVIKIQHTVVKNRTIIAKDKTKSVSSKRSYQLLPEVKELLLKIKDKQIENAKLFGNCYCKSDYIFIWQDGKLYRPDYITRAFQRALKDNGLPKMRFHDLRHSTASILYDKGWELKDIQEWLGHADIEMTGNIYTHISKLRKQSMAKNLEHTFSL